MNLKINTRVLSKMSLIINKMGVSNLILDMQVEALDEKQAKEKLVKELIKLVLDNLYKAEEEITSLIADVKGITKEEAEDVDIIGFFKEIFSIEAIRDFFKLS